MLLKKLGRLRAAAHDSRPERPDAVSRIKSVDAAAVSITRAGPLPDGAGRTNGTPIAVRSVKGAPAPVVRLYLHPGRELVQTMDLDRLLEQFDLDTAERFPDLASAEAGCASPFGFLAEIDGEFDDGRGGDRPRTAAFAIPALRR